MRKGEMMSTQKKGLGKGLSALIADTGYSYEEESQSNGGNQKVFKAVHISLITPNPYQPRTEFSKPELEELAESIKEHGILQPVTVRQAGSGYQIIAGERRTQAAKIAGLTEIPVIVKNYTDREAFELAIIENIQREDLNPLEEALAYKRFSKEFDLTQEEIAKRVGKSRAHVANMLRILHLPADVKELIIEGKISAGHAKSLLKAPNIHELANRIVNDNLSVRQLEEQVKLAKGLFEEALDKIGNSPKKPSPKPTSEKLSADKDSDMLELEQLLTSATKMPVSINDTLDGGEVVIKFKSLEQLDWIIERLGNENLNF